MTRFICKVLSQYELFFRRRSPGSFPRGLVLLVVWGGVAGSLANPAGAQSYLSQLEADIVREHNLLRRNPEGYARLLEDLRVRFRGNSMVLTDRVELETQEGVAAVDEAIDALLVTSPKALLRPSRGLSAAARDHVRDQGPIGGVGHEGSDGSWVWDRASRHGSWDVQVAENISYGPDVAEVTARGVVMQLLIDDGVPDRGHRATMLDPTYERIGVSCGSHSRFTTMCVITFAAAYTER